MQIELEKLENPRHILMMYEHLQNFQADSSPSHFSLCCSFTELPLSFISYSIFTVIRPLEKPLIPGPVLSPAACGLWASPAVKTCFVCPLPDEMGQGEPFEPYKTMTSDKSLLCTSGSFLPISLIEVSSHGSRKQGGFLPEIQLTCLSLRHMGCCFGERAWPGGQLWLGALRNKQR